MTTDRDPPPSSPLSYAEAWDRVAAEYVRDLTPPFETFARDALARLGVARGARVLDVAAGPGTFALLAARAGAHVTAIDIAPRMIAMLGERALEMGLHVDARVGDATSLPFAESAFDAAFCLFGVMFFPDRARGLRELHRVLAPGGRAAITSWAPLDRTPEMNVLYRSFGELTGGPPRTGAMPLSDPDACRRELTEAGFIEIEVEEREAHVEYASTAEMVDATTRSSAPIALAREAMGPRWESVAQSLRERVTEQLGAGPQRAALLAYLTTGRKR